MKKRLLCLGLIFTVGCMGAVEDDPGSSGALTEETNENGDQNQTLGADTEAGEVDENEDTAITEDKTRDEIEEEATENATSVNPEEPFEAADGSFTSYQSLNESIALRTDHNLQEAVYAFTGAEESSVFVCGLSSLFNVNEAEGETTLTSASCDALLVHEGTLYFNHRSDGSLFAFDTTSSETGNDSLVSLREAEKDTIRNMSVVGSDESLRIALATGDGGISFFDPTTQSIDDSSAITDIAAMHVMGLPGTTLLAAGTRDGVSIFDSASGDLISSTEILSGSSDLGWLEDVEGGGFKFVSVNPLGLTTIWTGDDGVINVADSLKTFTTGGHPFVIRNGVASLWSELITVGWTNSASGIPVLDILARTSSTYEAPDRTINRHFVDVLDRQGDTLVAAYDSGVMWFDVSAQESAPDIHSNNLVLKMSPFEPGGPSSVLALFLNRGHAPLEVTDIAIDNDQFSYTLDSPDAGVDGTPLLTIAPGDSGYFELAYPGGDGQEVAKITLTTNDPDEPTYTITARVNFPNIEPGFALPSDLVPDSEGRLHALTDWEGKIKYAKFFNGL